TAMPVATLQRSPGPMWAASQACRSRPASPSWARLGSVAPALSLANLSSTRASLDDGEIVEPMQLGDRHLRMDEHSVLPVGSLETAGDLVQLVQPAALGIGDQQLHLRQGLLEGGLDPLAESIQPLLLDGGDEDCVRMGELDLASLLLGEQVGLVE